MPYKLSASGKTVLVKQGRKWVALKVHPSKAAAQAHLYALRKNVKGSHG